ncbi:MAG TPA: TetR/AcrR family transcriptional regulator [Streptosporangiaceae bacterium]|nr:TetR/AcrR family transcriptional regulator [Streptosporangiaceae bacterium]
MTAPVTGRVPSARQDELLELAYQYVLVNGLAEMSLRPLARAIGSSPRVLLFLYGSKDNLIRALLGRARADELAAVGAFRAEHSDAGLIDSAHQVWQWLSADGHRHLLGLWVEAYARSLVDPAGPWAGFAAQTVQDWLGLLAERQPPARRRTRAGAAERTAVLAVLRGAMLDLLATGDAGRTTGSVTLALRALRPPGQSAG